MAAHYRKTIRAAIKTALTGLTTTGANVFDGRLSPIGDDEMPCWVILPVSETAQPDAMGVAEREARMVIEGMVSGGDDLFNLLDGMAAEAETALLADYTLGGKVDLVAPPETQFDIDDFGGEGEARIGKITLDFPISYRTAYADPTTQR